MGKESKKKKNKILRTVGDKEILELEKTDIEVDNLSDLVKDGITPLFELTRSRTTRKLKEGDIFRRLAKLNEIFGDRRFFLDLTDDPNLSNKQIRRLHSNKR